MKVNAFNLLFHSSKWIPKGNLNCFSRRIHEVPLLKPSLKFYKQLLKQPQPNLNVDTDANVSFLAVEEGPASLRTYSVGNVSHMYNGIRVPPKPEEPLNCCQSGCSICVWDVFADDLEEYNQARRKAKRSFLEKQMTLPKELESVSLEETSSLKELPPQLQAFVLLEKRLAQEQNQQ
ncbi:mitochondrial oxidoreductase-like protein, OXLD1-like protein [Schizosaccharomyces osmophilus]|uniref:Mitochondrial oxidoreductase-like protein, OXLD1-like protein n=1 Tax=Schizosaccharomyces osmophilus TaxID=2545709 RepID=A0AAE9WJ10_9SCHI|nr:mitochondrial oxidoreductase-like protein, OXLD1-like protein [Schizosaccharomyces osmophilus]WBW75432.1 mitochondrial oxidoreductase-like protein, OXLD1-like protein [Schizosaccharomyces osmophilus]